MVQITMIKKFPFLLILIGLYFNKNVYGIKCIASVGDTCEGATYCQGTWKESGGTYSAVSQDCVFTTLGYSLGNSWTYDSSTETYTHTCDTDNCNSKPPSGNVPTTAPNPTFPPITCYTGPDNNQPPTKTCTGEACYILDTNSYKYTDCAFDKIAETLLNVTIGHYCVRTTSSVNNGNPVATSICYCHTTDKCNNQMLLHWGETYLNNMNNVSCKVGTDINPSMIGTATGEYCYFSNTTYNGKATVVWAALSTTLAVPPFGCIEIYGGKNPSTTCTCGTDMCNVNGYQTTTMGPVTVTTPGNGPTTNPPVTTTPTTQPHTGPTTTQMPISGGAVQILLISYDNSDGGGRLYSGSHCDPFWFTLLNKCDINLQICIEPYSGSSSSLNSCETGWVDLQKLTDNSNTAYLKPNTRYGGWYNPATYVNGFQNAQGFWVKFMAQDVDPGAMQLIDIAEQNYTYAGQPNQGTITFTHQRPTGYKTSLKFSYQRIPNPSPSHGWRAVPGSKIIFLPSSAHFTEDKDTPDLLAQDLSFSHLH